MQKVYLDVNKQSICWKDYSPSYEFGTTHTLKDSVTISKDSSFLFIEVFYHIRNTPERFIFIYIARIHGQRDGEWMRSVEQVYFDRSNIPD